MEYEHYPGESPQVQTNVKDDLGPSKYCSFGLEGLTLPFGFVRKLGSGGHGQVDEVYDLSSTSHFVRKSVLRKRVDVRGSSPMRHLKNELAVLKNLKHPNLVELVGAYTDSTHCHLIMHPVADQNLDSLMRSSREGTQGQPNHTVRWIQDLCSALMYLHSCGVKHLDIKPQNIVIKGDQILLADFGTAKSILSHEINVPEKVVVTPMYCAPETIDHGQQDYSADIFSMGCVFSEMITVYLQHSVQDFEEFRSEDHIKAFHLTIPKAKTWLQQLPVPEHLTQNVVQVIVQNVIKMLDKSPENRPKSTDLHHVFNEKFPYLASIWNVGCHTAPRWKLKDATCLPGEFNKLTASIMPPFLLQESSTLPKEIYQDSGSSPTHFPPLEGHLNSYEITDDFREHRMTQTTSVNAAQNGSFQSYPDATSSISDPSDRACSVAFSDHVPSLSSAASSTATSDFYDPSNVGDRAYAFGLPIFGDLNLHPSLSQDHSFGGEETDDFALYSDSYPYGCADPSVSHGEFFDATKSFPNRWRIPPHLLNSPGIEHSYSLYPTPQFTELSPFRSWVSIEEMREKGCCPYPECGKIFKDLKAHMLTHQIERPEKCPIQSCDYHVKGFARKYDKNRHTLTHYKGVMVCGFCPGV